MHTFSDFEITSRIIYKMIALYFTFVNPKNALKENSCGYLLSNFFIYAARRIRLSEDATFVRRLSLITEYFYDHSLEIISSQAASFIKFFSHVPAIICITRVKLKQPYPEKNVAIIPEKRNNITNT